MSKKKQKKKARITNRQAKIRQKSKKPSKQANSKYKKLREQVKMELKEQGLYTEDIESIEPPDDVEMSAVILKLAEPLLKKHGDYDMRIETILSLTIAGWNILMLPEDKQEMYQDKMIDKLAPPDNEAATVGFLLYLIELITERKKKYFPDLKKVIVNHELIVSDGDISLNISSAPVESNR